MLWATDGAYRRKLVVIGGSWCLQEDVGAYRRILVGVGAHRRKLVLVCGEWCL